MSDPIIERRDAERDEPPADPLSPERVKAALEWADMCPIPPYRENVNACETLAALARVHIDATKREPPAGLVEVIAEARAELSVWSESDGSRHYARRLSDDGVFVDCADFASAAEARAYINNAIARAVVEFLTSDAALMRAAVACDGTDADRHDDPLYMIRAALGVKEGGK